jgi:pyruvate formate lyase activating enzyme
MKAPGSLSEAVSRRLPRVSRRQALRVGAAGAALLTAGPLAFQFFHRRHKAPGREGITRADPNAPIWQLWRRRGWAREASHWERLEDGVVKCLLCPNGCTLNPGERGRCHDRANWGGILHTLVYGNPCAFHVDPIEKKPLMHFLPGTSIFSLSTAGCCLRCLNCQNWDISQRAPEETKDPSDPELRATPVRMLTLTPQDAARLAMFPEEVVALAEAYRCPSIAGTYAEPIVAYEYMREIGRQARARGLRMAWITCGNINRKPLEEACAAIDAANVNLKSFSDDIYNDLNGGRLGPVLETLRVLKGRGVWFEVTNLIVPTYTDKFDMIARMCDWLVKEIGTDYPLHFSRFHPAHKLLHLPDTSPAVLAKAREIALRSGVRHVYIGNLRGDPSWETTFCPGCRRAVVEREAWSIRAIHLKGGACAFCGHKVAGVWA